MRNTFFNYYIQCIGSCFGILACIYSYLNGYMFVYGNILNNIDNMTFLGLVGSILLFPFCLISLLLGIIKLYISKTDGYYPKTNFLNKILIVFTIILGFSGARIYFLIPCALMSFGLFNFNTDTYDEADNNEEDSVTLNDKEYIERLHNIEESPIKNNVTLNELQEDENITLEDTLTFKPVSQPKINKVDSARINMAKDLLNKNVDIKLIQELTGYNETDLATIKNASTNM